MQPELTLENRLEDVKIGDIILMENPDLTVAGYVRHRSHHSVILSYVDPNSAIQGKGIVWDGYATWRGLWNRDRTYALKKFSSFHVLKGAAEEALALSEPEGEAPAQTAAEEGVEDQVEEDSYSRVKVGEVLLLESENLNVVGFVVYKTSERIFLSHVDPNSVVQGDKIRELGYTTTDTFHDGRLMFKSSMFEWSAILKELQSPVNSNHR
ncbi:MAG: hypothetical protein AABX70_02980 [Nanoarchaeota archaeon]